MESSVRDLFTMLHGMGFGALLLLGFPLAIVEVTRMSGAQSVSAREEILLSRFLWVMAAVAWMAVLLGAYLIYPYYRVRPPAGVSDLAMYPRSLLLSSATTSGWHDIGMEWKEHVAWLAPMILTMVAWIFGRYGAIGISRHPETRRVVLVLMVTAFLAAGTAGGFGAMLNKFAPVRGGAVIHLMQGEAP